MLYLHHDGRKTGIGEAEAQEFVRAVFLDRDGVINKHRVDYVKSTKELEILPQAGDYLKKIRDLDYMIIIITNQSAVHRKLMTIQDLASIHKNLVKRMKESDCIIDDIFYCPHVPEENCGCRKPATGLFMQAQLKHNIQLINSWMVGDSDQDIQAGTNAGCMTIKIKRNGTLRKAYEIIKSHS